MAISSTRAAERRQTGKKSPKPRPARKSMACRVPRPGQKCSECRQGRLDYDGLLQLVCPVCGHLASGGGFT